MGVVVAALALTACGGGGATGGPLVTEFRNQVTHGYPAPIGTHVVESLQGIRLREGVDGPVTMSIDEVTLVDAVGVDVVEIVVGRRQPPPHEIDREDPFANEEIVSLGQEFTLDADGRLLLVHFIVVAEGAGGFEGYDLVYTVGGRRHEIRLAAVDLNTCGYPAGVSFEDSDCA